MTPSAENDAAAEPVGCCASGRCEVCTPGYEWGGGYVFPPEDGKHEVWCDGTRGCGMDGCADA